MAGKRYRNTKRAAYDIGGILKFVDGYWPPLSEPPSEDNGLCKFIENDPTFGLFIHEVDATFTMKEREASGGDASMLDKAEAVLARMNLGKPKEEALGKPKPKPIAKPALPPGPLSRKDFPPNSKIKQTAKKGLLHMAARLEIISPAFKKKTNKVMAATIIAKLDDME